jgi:centractin
MAGVSELDCFIGKQAQEMRGLLSLRYPIEHGIVQDWEDMEKIWSFLYAEELKCASEDVSFYSLFEKISSILYF